MSTFKLNPKKEGMWKGQNLKDVEKAKSKAKRSGNVTREREAQFAINAKEGKFGRKRKGRNPFKEVK